MSRLLEVIKKEVASSKSYSYIIATKGVFMQIANESKIYISKNLIDAKKDMERIIENQKQVIEALEKKGKALEEKKKALEEKDKALEEMSRELAELKERLKKEEN